MNGGEPIRSYRAFWPYYLREHAGAKTRAIHIAGTLTALALTIAVILGANPWLLAAALAAGYGPAWAAHGLLEKNRPATLSYPVWSLVSDLKMTAAWLTGNLEHELEKAGLPPPGAKRS